MRIKCKFFMCITKNSYKQPGITEMSVFTGGKLHQNFIPIPYYTIITKPPCHIKQSNETITLWIKFKILTPIPTTSQSTSHLAFLTISCVFSNKNIFNQFVAKISYSIRWIGYQKYYICLSLYYLVVSTM